MHAGAQVGFDLAQQRVGRVLVDPGQAGNGEPLPRALADEQPELERAAA